MEAAEKTAWFGPAGWSYPDWNGTIHESGGRLGLESIAAVFDLVEINTTFYRHPVPEQTRSWVGRVSGHPSFLFAAKLFQGFTHVPGFGPSEVERYRTGIAPLVESGRLAAVLAQFPWSFRRSDENRRHLDRLIDAFADAPLVVEFRHESWDTDGVLTELTERGVGFCNSDAPSGRGSIPGGARVTGSLGYLRLHGRNAANWFRQGASRDERYDYLYGVDELRPLAQRVLDLVARASRVLVVTNNHFGGSAVANALELRSLVLGVKTAVPARWLRAFPRLHAVATPIPEPQLELFA